jgi:hypothetical protein
MKTLSTGLWLLIIVAWFIHCTPSRLVDRSREAAIPVLNERLYLAPIINESGFETMEGWPETTFQQKALLRNLITIWRQLTTEFRRCEKYGNYHMVDSYDNPTVRISITLSQLELRNDSMYVPVHLQVERITDDRLFIYTIPASSPVPALDPAQPNPFYHLGRVLSEYRRQFPYRQIVSFFYPHQ